MCEAGTLLGPVSHCGRESLCSPVPGDGELVLPGRWGVGGLPGATAAPTAERGEQPLVRRSGVRTLLRRKSGAEAAPRAMSNGEGTAEPVLRDKYEFPECHVGTTGRRNSEGQRRVRRDLKVGVQVLCGE